MLSFNLHLEFQIQPNLSHAVKVATLKKYNKYEVLIVANNYIIIYAIQYLCRQTIVCHMLVCY